ncbi:hypothetical protein BpHYR1_005975 [Brachionus plicatilis]|uniref:Uncharacterized protein n=1 Tax=Brachionus plicatilis TaxID=10195 RepID=A0A3M7SW89_BRAPC|nr:hypothetical protein BpHYR1_005975 [Brachionus plicatilis]
MSAMVLELNFALWQKMFSSFYNQISKLSVDLTSLGHNQNRSITQIIIPDKQLNYQSLLIKYRQCKPHKQCKSDKLLINTESSAKKLKEMTIKEATRMIEKTENESKTIRPSLVRRHTITTMPISAACLVKDNTFGNLNGKYSQHGCQTPTDFAVKDTKAFVGSFTHTSNSHTSTPLRRAETLYRKHTYIPEDNEQVNTPKSIKLANSVGSTPAKVSNNFNNDFYRLCTDTFFDGSEPNFANSQSDSVNSLPFKLKQVESEHLDDLQSNVSSHVNNLFDQWLVNSKN